MKVSRVKKPYTPFLVRVPKSITGTRPVRKFFATRPEAESFIVRVRMDGFSRADIRDGKQERPGGVGMRLAEASAIFQTESENTSASTRAQLRYVLGSLERKFGHRVMEELDHQELAAWLKDLEASRMTVWNHYRIARRFFQYAVDFLEIIPRNPFKKIKRPPAPDYQEARVLDPVEMRRCLSIADNLEEPVRSQLLGYLCLGGFAGLRSKEILHMQWEDLDFKTGEIYVRQPKRVRGWRPRYIEMLPPFRKWMLPIAEDRKPLAGEIVNKRVRGAGGKYAPRTDRVFPGGLTALGKLRKHLSDGMGWDAWPSNCLRHSYGTYHLAAFKDLAKLQTQMGHESEDITRSRYAMPAKKVAAGDWWAL